MDRVGIGRTRGHGVDRADPLRHQILGARGPSALVLAAGLATALVLPLGGVSGAVGGRPSGTTPRPPITVRAESSQPVARAAPYEYLGWGDPQPPTGVLAATGIHDLTLAFILAHKGCHPEWDGTRPLLGGSDAAAIAAIRSAGGNVDVSFGGWSGTKLGTVCRTVSALTAAYQQVVGDYELSAIDVDIEHTEFTKPAARQRVIQALAALQQKDPTLEISITFSTTETGPDPNGRAMISQAASLGFQPYAWTIMPFDFGAPVTDMGGVSIQAAQGLEADIVAAYAEPVAAAYAHIGISSMNGETDESDESDETVTLADFQQVVAFAQTQHLARLTFWAVNRDRPCGSGLSTQAGSCSGISQAPYAFTDLLDGYSG
jgi:chitinase